MKVYGSIVLITGANSGIGKAYAAEVVKRGASKVYVTARNPGSLGELVKAGDDRMIPLSLDVTSPAQIEAAVAAAPDLTLLINNAGYAAFEGAISAPDLTDARREMEVNYFAPIALIRAFRPHLVASGEGAVLNMLSMMALVSVPMAATYAGSKAAFFS